MIFNRNHLKPAWALLPLLLGSGCFKQTEPSYLQATNGPTLVAPSNLSVVQLEQRYQLPDNRKTTPPVLTPPEDSAKG